MIYTIGQFRRKYFPRQYKKQPSLADMLINSFKKALKKQG